MPSSARKKKASPPHLGVAPDGVDPPCVGEAGVYCVDAEAVRGELAGDRLREFVAAFFFFFNDTATTEIYTLSLHYALPISTTSAKRSCTPASPPGKPPRCTPTVRDRKSTRLNSSHDQISYAVFCLKKK